MPRRPPASRAARRAARRAALAALAALLALAAACSRDAPQGATPAAASPARPGGGRPAPTIALAEGDVATVRRGPVEEATPITGDLRPIETVEIRARLDGDIDGVYVREGQRVARGQLLARFESSEQESGRRSAEADRASAQTELATAEWSLEQTRELFRAGAVPERDVKAAEQAVAAARAKLAAAEARIRSTSSLVRDTRVLATTDGVIEKRTVESGEHVARGTPLFTLVRNDVLELAAAVPARRASDVVVGQTVHFSAGGRSFDGRVARVSPTIDPATRAITVYVQVPNASGALKGGTFATGRVVSRTVRDAVIVPTAALRQTPRGDKPFVYRIAGQTLDVAPVTLGIVDEAAGVAQVADGLREGDRVVVGNVGSLGRGMTVQTLGSEKTR